MQTIRYTRQNGIYYTLKIKHNLLSMVKAFCNYNSSIVHAMNGQVKKKTSNSSYVFAVENFPGPGFGAEQTGPTGGKCSLVCASFIKVSLIHQCMPSTWQDKHLIFVCLFRLWVKGAKGTQASEYQHCWFQYIAPMLMVLGHLGGSI